MPKLDAILRVACAFRTDWLYIRARFLVHACLWSWHQGARQNQVACVHV